MSYWKILGVKPDADAKTIKLAYSKLLKKTRPEDDPEGFTALHSAYKSALAMAKHRSAVATQTNHREPEAEQRSPHEPAEDLEKRKSDEANRTKPEPTKNDLDQSAATIETVRAPKHTDDEPADTNIKVEHAAQPTPTDSNPNPPIIETLQAPEHTDDDEPASGGEGEEDSFQQPEYEEALHNDYKLIAANLETLIISPKRVNKIEEWRSIESVPSMVDLDFNAQVSHLLFSAVSEANLESLKKGDLHVKQPVLRYLNDYFQWETNWQQFEETYGTDQSNAIFKFTTSNQENTPNLKLHYFGRIMAFGVDMILGVICFYIATKVPGLSFFKNIAVMYFLLVIPIMEASPLQASVGKKMFQLAVVDRSGLRLRWYHSFFRSYITYFCLLGIKLVIWINMFTSYKYNLLLQDLITRSDVVERE